MANTNAFQAFSKNVTNHTKISYDAASLIVSYFLNNPPKDFNHCYINVMNNAQINIAEHQNMYIRKDHGFAQISVVYYKKENDKSFRNFSERKYYYIVRSDGNMFTLREDLVKFWHTDTCITKPDVLILDVTNNKVMIKSAEQITKYFFNMERNQSQNKDFNRLFNIKACSWNEWSYVTSTSETTRVNAFMAEYNQFLGAAQYAKYRDYGSNVKLIGIRNGKKTVIEYKSIKQAYDEIVAHHLFDMSYKTFQRRCRATPKAIECEDGSKYYVTTLMDFNGPDVFEDK